MRGVYRFDDDIIVGLTDWLTGRTSLEDSRKEKSVCPSCTLSCLYGLPQLTTPLQYMCFYHKVSP